MTQRIRSRAGWSLRSAFTLVEMLVVTAIMLLIVALLLPLLSWARKSAQMSQCLNNQRQLGNLFGLYHATYDEWWLPCSYSPDSIASQPQLVNAGYKYDPLDLPHSNGVNGVAWYNYLDGIQPVIYIPHVGGIPEDPHSPLQWIMKCPAASSWAWNPAAFISYGYNAYGLGVNESYTTYPVRRVSSIVRPANQLVIADTRGEGAGSGSEGMWRLAWDGVGSNCPPGVSTLWPYYRHMNGTPNPDVNPGMCNALFADMHAQACRPNTTPGPECAYINHGAITMPSEWVSTFSP